MRNGVMLCLLMIMMCHPHEISSLAAQNTGQRPVITLQNAGQLTEIARLGRGNVTDIAWSPDGTVLAVGGWLGIWLYEADAFDHTPRWLADCPVTHLAWASEGMQLASVGNGLLCVWDGEMGTLLESFEIPFGRLGILVTHLASVTDLAWAPGKPQLAIGDQDGRVHIWNTHTGEVESVWDANIYTELSLAWSPDGSRLATGGYALTMSQNQERELVRIWNTETLTEVASLPGHTYGVTSLAWAPDGTRLAAGGSGKVNVWDMQNQQILQEFHQVWLTSLAWSPDGNRLATGEQQGEIRVWDIHSGDLLHTLPGHLGDIASVAWSPKGMLLASVGAADHMPRIWNTQTGELTDTLEQHMNTVWSVAWSPDSRWLATGNTDATVRVLDIQNDVDQQILIGHRGMVYSVAWSPDGIRLASGGWGPSLYVWDTQTWDVQSELDTRMDDVHHIVWSPDGARLVAVGDISSIGIWDAHTWEVSRHLDGQLGWVTQATWSPDGTRLATANTWSGDEVATGVHIWDPNNGTHLAGFPVDNVHNNCSQIAWSPDGTHIAGGTIDGSIWVWVVADGLATRLTGHDEGVLGLTWSPDGLLLASVGWDGTVRVWDAARGVELILLKGHVGGVSAIEWSPDGTLLVTGGHDGTIRVWGIER